jgi:hypothetical protein
MSDAVLVAVVAGAVNLGGLILNRLLASAQLEKNTAAVKEVHVAVNSEREKLLLKVDGLNKEISDLVQSSKGKRKRK